MIIKIKSHKRPVFKWILEYMLKNKEWVDDKEKKSFVISHNLKGKGIDSWVNQFKKNETYRLRKRKDSIILTHEILSWHREDAKNLTQDKMEEMAREYIRLRNPNGIYVAVPHFDKDHYHIHIMASGIEYKTGKSLRLSKQNLQKLKKDIQNYQLEKFPELYKSVVLHGKKEKAIYSQKEYQMKLRTGRESNKDLLSTMLKTCYKKANSRDTFYALLKECGLKTYERSGKINGIRYEDQKYRFKKFGFTDDRLNELEKTKDRKTDLGRLRENKAERSVEKDLELTGHEINH